MSDDPTTPSEGVEETAQGAVESTSTPPPWGDDFSPERAWSTISHLRGREKELESESKAFKRLREDPAALSEFLSEMGYEIGDDEPEEPVYEDDGTGEEYQTPAHDPRLDSVLQWQQQVESERAQQRFDRDLKEFSGDRDVSSQGRDWILNETIRTGDSKDALGKATKAWLEFEDELRASGRDEYQKTKRAPASAPRGSSGAVDRDPRDRNARRERMAASIVAAREE